MDCCRICLDTKGTVSINELAKQQERTPLTYKELIEDLLLLELNEACFPQILCTSCATAVWSFHEFRNKAHSNDIKLRAALNLPTRSDCIKTVKELEEAVAIKVQQVVGTLKDPLEESDDEATPEMPITTYNLTNNNKNNLNDDEDGYDEDDNKPLRQLIKINGEQDTSMNAVVKTVEDNCRVVGVVGGDSDVDDLKVELREEDEYITSENMCDLISAEEQIFPSGRYKCKTCAKTYFTTVGLQAHSAVHLIKSAVTKKKRTRGPNRKKPTNSAKDKGKANAKSKDVIEDDDAFTSARQRGETAETTAFDTETEATTMGNNNRLRKKQRPPKPKKIFPCQVCGKQMISASKLRYHMVMHTGEKDYLCTMCPKAYSTIYALKHHIRVHTGERPYECKFCGDRFLRPTTLKSHLRRHTGERPYGCNICGKRFIQHSSMTTHIKLNHMDKNIPCPYCEKKYARQTDLNTHLLSHTGDKPFSCKLCPSRFIRQANLNKHMNQHHSTEAKTSKSSSNSRQRQNQNATDVNDQPATITSELRDNDHITDLCDIKIPELRDNTLIAPAAKDQTSYANIEMHAWNWETQS